MTHLSGVQLQHIAERAARRYAPWLRDDVAGDVALKLVRQDPLTIEAAVQLARREADASRHRIARAARRAAQDGVDVGDRAASDVVDQVAARILLDAALHATQRGLDCSSSRMVRRVL